jgi:hypothetical protein
MDRAILRVFDAFSCVDWWLHAAGRASNHCVENSTRCSPPSRYRLAPTVQHVCLLLLLEWHICQLVVRSSIHHRTHTQICARVAQRETTTRHDIEERRQQMSSQDQTQGTICSVCMRRSWRAPWCDGKVPVASDPAPSRLSLLHVDWSGARVW